MTTTNTSHCSPAPVAFSGDGFAFSLEENVPCLARDQHVLLQGKVLASPVRAAMQRFTPVGMSSQPGPLWLTRSLEQQLYEPLHISTLPHYCCLLFYRAPERCVCPSAGAAPGELSSSAVPDSTFPEIRILGGLSAQAPWALPCGDSAGSTVRSCQAWSHRPGWCSQTWCDWYELGWTQLSVHE